MKNLLLVFILLLSVHKLFAQSCIYKGIYIDKIPFTVEGKRINSIELVLNKDGTFIYTHNKGRQADTVNGNWQKRDSSIILDSAPQRESLICFESIKKQLKEIEIDIVSRYPNGYVPYRLGLITIAGDTNITDVQYVPYRTIQKFLAFFVITDQWQSPVYKIKQADSNYFKVYFDSRRRFENEAWKIDSDTIYPTSVLGNVESYVLTRLIRTNNEN